MVEKCSKWGNLKTTYWILQKIELTLYFMVLNDFTEFQKIIYSFSNYHLETLRTARHTTLQRGITYYLATSCGGV